MRSRRDPMILLTIGRVHRESGRREQEWSAIIAALDTLGVPPRLLKVGLQSVAVLTLGGHRDLRLQLAHERQLGAMGLVQVLHDLLLLRLVHEVKFPC